MNVIFDDLAHAEFNDAVVYSIEKDYLYIIAIAHMHREPHYWIKRVKSGK